MVWKATVAAIVFCTASGAVAQTFREQVDAEKQALAKDVDQSMLRVLREPGRDLSGLNLNLVRRKGFWLVMAPIIGMCYENGGSDIYVAWLSAVDLTGFEPAATRAKGVETVMEMKQRDLLAKATPVRRSAFCKVKIAAVSETLSERFGVR